MGILEALTNKIKQKEDLIKVYKKDNKTGNSIKRSLSNTKKILLTATPLQNSLLELYGLTSIGMTPKK